MILKIFKNVLVMVVLLIALSEIGNTQEIDEGGIELENGCYTLLIIVEGDHGKKQITVQDCRGGRAI